MEQNQSQLSEGSHSYGGNSPPYQEGWNLYMYTYQGPPTHWFPQGFMQPPHNGPAMHPPQNIDLVSPPGNAEVVAPAPNAPNPSPIDVEEVEVVTGVDGPSTERRKGSGCRTKLPNFHPEEDVNLMKSWLEISCDPVTSTGQKNGRFWDRVMKQYNSRRGCYPQRSLKSIQSCWDGIKLEAGKFAGFVADSHPENASGMSDADKTTQAAATYAGVIGHHFPYMHCWEILKDEPKWQDTMNKGAATAPGYGFGDHIPHNSNTIDLDGDEPSPTVAGKRPMGRDAAKSGSRKKNCSSGSTSSSEYASKLQDLSLQKISIWQEENSRKVDRFDHLATIEEKRFDEMREHNKSILRLEQEKVRIMRDKLDMQMWEKEKEMQEREKQEDERILKIDLDSCSPDLRVYYQTLREDIFEKIAARRQRN